MSAPFRIERPDARTLAPGDEFRSYLERLLKMIPGEIVGLYMIGSGFLPQNNLGFEVGWILVTLVLLFIVRLYGTADPKLGKPAQQVPVGIAAVAFVIWIFWLGGPFEQLNIPYREQLASLAVLVWSFIIPIIYKGPADRPL